MDLTEQLRAAVRDSGLSVRQLALRAGLPYAVVHRFVNEQADLNMRTASKLATLVGLELRPIRGKPKKGKG